MASTKYAALHNAFFYNFFCKLEPLLTFIAAAYALLLPERYMQSAVPISLAPLPPKALHLAYKSTLHLLGNCYALLGGPYFECFIKRTCFQGASMSQA